MRGDSENGSQNGRRDKATAECFWLQLSSLTFSFSEYNLQTLSQRMQEMTNFRKNIFLQFSIFNYGFLRHGCTLKLQLWRYDIIVVQIAGIGQ
jgi:hypothetical protein